MPIKGNATTSTTVNVVDNYSSGIECATLTATLNDGTILGFYYNDYSEIFFCGAISQKSELTIPDSIIYNSKRIEVKYIGYNSICDFDNAQGVKSLTLPKTTTYIFYIPPTVKVLHTRNYFEDISTELLSRLDKVLVPAETLESYYGNNYWSNNVLINTEGTEPLRITVTMKKAGEFAQLLLQQTDHWFKVNELTVIGELNTDDLDVFKRMKQLTKLDLSRAVISNIPDYFNGLEYNDVGLYILEELILPEVNRIGHNAFYGCSRLKNIKIHKVNSLGDAVFKGVSASKINLPEGLTTIGNAAFSGCKLESITLPEGLTSIGNEAFSDCKLESITLPSTLTKISHSCFRGCSRLKSINIPPSITLIEDYAFENTVLTSVNLPGIKTIYNYAFHNCKQLTEVKFAEGLEGMGWSSFEGCTALTEIDLPSSFLSMSGQAFNGCYNIKKVISRAIVPPTHNNNNSILNGCDKTDVKLYVPAISIDKYRAENGWKTFYTILPIEEKTSYAYIYDDITIDDATEFTDNLDMEISWRYQNRNGSSKYYCGALEYNGSTILSMYDYKQFHYMGYYDNNNPYSYNTYFTSLISNGTMRSDKVQTTLKVHNTGPWYFISLPYDVKVSDITYSDGTQFAIRKYSGHNRAIQNGNTWVNLTGNDVMHAYEGYILRCNKSDADFTFPAINNANRNKVFEKESVVMPLEEYISEFEHNRSWNLIGNPYPCYYDTRYMDFTAPITVWNNVYARYDAYSPVDDSYILHPSQSFFVQRPIDQASITFDKAGRQKNATVHDLQANARKRVATNSQRKIFNVHINNGTDEDHTRFVFNDDATPAYELDKDASKFISDDNAAMLVYTIENGIKYAINERSMAEGIINLGFYTPTDGDFTLSLNTREQESLILIDHETNTETILSGEYYFTAKSGYNDSRFTIMLGETTSINTIKIDNDVISAKNPFSVFTIDGRLVGNYDAGTTVKLSKGIYVINSKDVKRKVVVR